MAERTANQWLDYIVAPEAQTERTERATEMFSANIYDLERDDFVQKVSVLFEDAVAVIISVELMSFIESLKSDGGPSIQKLINGVAVLKGNISSTMKTILRFVMVLIAEQGEAERQLGDALCDVDFEALRKSLEGDEG